MASHLRSWSEYNLLMQLQSALILSPWYPVASSQTTLQMAGRSLIQAQAHQVPALERQKSQQGVREFMPSVTNNGISENIIAMIMASRYPFYSVTAQIRVTNVLWLLKQL